MITQFSKSVLTALLAAEARAVVRTYRPKIVAVTGSVGKTSTKDAIYSVLAERFHVRKSQKSFNSELGLPLTILGVPNGWRNPLRWAANLIDGLFLLLLQTSYPEWLVLEVGADRPGDIRSLARWLPVDIAVLTRLPEVPVHVEFFDSPEQVAEEKASLINALKEGGTLVLFGDDPNVRALAGRARDAHTKTFGFGSECDVRAEDFRIVFEEGKKEWEKGLPIGASATLVLGDERIPFEVLGTVGRHTLLPALAAVATGRALDIPLPDIMHALKNYEPPRGRMRLLSGIKDSLLIDDSYNSSPAAVHAALETLAMLPARHRVVVLGDMTELGRYSIDEHRKVGSHAAEIADLLVTVGFRAQTIVQGALDAGLSDTKIFQYEDSRVAGAELKNMLQSGDCVLIKGSQAMRMERTVEELMQDPLRAPELLVRQDAEWKRR